MTLTENMNIDKNIAFASLCPKQTCADIQSIWPVQHIAAPKNSFSALKLSITHTFVEGDHALRSLQMTLIREPVCALNLVQSVKMIYVIRILLLPKCLYLSIQTTGFYLYEIRVTAQLYVYEILESDAIRSWEAAGLTFLFSFLDKDFTLHANHNASSWRFICGSEYLLYGLIFIWNL